MRVIVLGGTWFVGRAITEALAAAGHDVLVVHRGVREPAGFPEVRHLHAERGAWASRRSELADFAPDAAVDVSAGDGAGAWAALAALPGGIRLVALSSVDVYRAYEALRAGTVTDAVPLTEESPLRAARHVDGPHWENLEVEEAYRAAGGTVLRLGAVWGEHDYQYRFEPVLRRVRAGRAQLPAGAGGLLFSRVYAGDAAQAVLAALAASDVAGECMNVTEARTASAGLFFQQVIEAAGARVEVVRVPDHVLPADLRSTAAHGQHLLASPAKAAELLGWHDTAGPAALRRAVAWHLDHPPGDPDDDFAADDAALRAAR